MIEAEGLRKVFGRKVAVADLSLRVAAGEVFGFLGPNGAGKTTAMKMLLGLVHPTAGRGFVLGHPVGSREARRWVGFLPEHFRFHDWMTGRELLNFHGQLHGLPATARAKRIETLLAQVDLADAADRPVGTYSKGMQQRLGLAQALIHQPKLVFLDEPTSGLDPIGRILVRDLIVRLRSEGVTVFSTHTFWAMSKPSATALCFSNAAGWFTKPRCGRGSHRNCTCALAKSHRNSSGDWLPSAACCVRQNVKSGCNWNRKPPCRASSAGWLNEGRRSMAYGCSARHSNPCFWKPWGRKNAPASGGLCPFKSIRVRRRGKPGLQHMPGGSPSRPPDP